MSDRHFTEQVVVRVSPDLHAALKLDALEHGRTVAQTIRFLLTTAMVERAERLTRVGVSSIPPNPKEH